MRCRPAGKHRIRVKLGIISEVIVYALGARHDHDVSHVELRIMSARGPQVYKEIGLEALQSDRCGNGCVHHAYLGLEDSDSAFAYRSHDKRIARDLKLLGIVEFFHKVQHFAVHGSANKDLIKLSHGCAPFPSLKYGSIIYFITSVP